MDFKHNSHFEYETQANIFSSCGAITDHTNYFIRRTIKITAKMVVFTRCKDLISSASTLNNSKILSIDAG